MPLQLIGMYLGRAGADLTLAENGRVGVDFAVAAHAAVNPFDVILTDMQMTELDGYGPTAELRRAGLDTPIVALTANAMSGDRDACPMAGCTDYLSEPLDRRKLVGMIHELPLGRTDNNAVFTLPMPT